MAAHDTQEVQAREVGRRPCAQATVTVNDNVANQQAGRKDTAIARCDDPVTGRDIFGLFEKLQQRLPAVVAHQQCLLI